MPTLGKFIQRRRVELGLTQEQLADRIGAGVRQSEISRLEHDRISLPRRQRLEQIAIALDVSLGQLLARSGWADAEQEFGNEGPPEVAAANGTPSDSEPSTSAADATPPEGQPPTPTTEVVPSNGKSFAITDTTLPLSDALSRAELLISQTGTIVEQSRLAVHQAQRSVRYDRSGRRREPLSQ